MAKRKIVSHTLIARIRFTFIDISFTMSSYKPFATLACIIGNFIRASATILAFINFAIVNVNFTISSCISIAAFTCVRCYSILIKNIEMLKESFCELFLDHSPVVN